MRIVALARPLSIGFHTTPLLHHRGRGFPCRLPPLHPVDPTGVRHPHPGARPIPNDGARPILRDDICTRRGGLGRGRRSLLLRRLGAAPACLCRHLAPPRPLAPLAALHPLAPAVRTAGADTAVHAPRRTLALPARAAQQVVRTDRRPPALAAVALAPFVHAEGRAAALAALGFVRPVFAERRPPALLAVALAPFVHAEGRPAAVSALAANWWRRSEGGEGGGGRGGMEGGNGGIERERK